MNVNGCVYCGELERTHPQKYDGLHPKGQNGYTAPDNLLRKVRLRFNQDSRPYPEGMTFPLDRVASRQLGYEA